MGLEPTTLGTTNRCSNQLSYNHHVSISIVNNVVTFQSFRAANICISAVKIIIALIFFIFIKQIICTAFEMITKAEIVQEFELRVFDESYPRVYKCLSLINQDQLWDSPNSNVPAIGCLVLHLCGNARQWILSGIGDDKDNRNREDEFIIHHNIRKSDFIFLLENLKVQLKNCLQNMPEDILLQRKKIQGYDVTGFSAIIHVIEHFSYHTGQITTLTKIYVDKDTGYYSGRNL